MLAVPKQVDQSFSSFFAERTRVHLFYAYLTEKIICRYSSVQKFKLEYPELCFSCTKEWQIVCVSPINSPISYYVLLREPFYLAL